MNVRDYKKFAPNNYYHLYNRGNGKQNVFLDKQDYMFFLSRLIEALYPLSRSSEDSNAEFKSLRHSPYKRRMLPNGAFDLICFCLMPNHFHLLIKQITTVPISKLISKVCTSYSKYFNKKYNHVGHIFQDQFKAVLVKSDSHALWLSAYIHQNPAVAGPVENLEDYPWSSYLEYLGLTQDVICKKNIITDHFANLDGYKKFVKDSFNLIKQRKELDNMLLD